jgi:hypothetical protein
MVSVTLDGRFVNAAVTSVPGKDPVSGSNSQPLFSTGYPGSGASFSSTIAARNKKQPP